MAGGPPPASLVRVPGCTRAAVLGVDGMYPGRVHARVHALLGLLASSGMYWNWSSSRPCLDSDQFCTIPYRHRLTN